MSAPTVRPLPTFVQTAPTPSRGQAVSTTLPPPPIQLLPLPTPLPTMAQTSIPPAPTSTNAPPLQIAVLPEWETAVKSAIIQIEQPWQLILNENPAALLENGTVDAALAWNADSGTLILQEPIALTVPFTTIWDEVTLLEAEEILLNGNELVIVQLWSDILATRKSLRINGRSPANPLYPLQNRLMLTTAKQETDISHLAQQLQAIQTPEPFIQITAVGDIMLDRALGAQIGAGNIAYPFANVADTLRSADLTIGNMESALGDIGTPADKSYPFRAPPAAAQSLAAAGFDVVTLANNHSLDYGSDALLQGIELLQAANVAPVGAGVNAEAAGAPYIVTVNGLTVAIFGYVDVPVEYLGFDTETWVATDMSPGLAWAESEQITAELTAVSTQTTPPVDLIIVILHSGYEYVEAPSPAQTAAARAAIDAGADLVIGHHAHILQGVEYYGDGVILYGLGNFAFEIDGPPETAVYNIWLDKNGVRELQLIPAIVQSNGQPRLATQEESVNIQQNVYRLTNLLNQ